MVFFIHKLGEERKRLEDEVGGAVAERAFKFIHHLSRFLGGQSIQGERWSGNVMA